MRSVLSRRIALFTAALVWWSAALAGGLPPWQFGMSRAEIEGQMTYGPYRAFSNGDVETYDGQFAGKKRNVQFYLRDDALVRIAVRMYEGTDLARATASWRETYAALHDGFGSVELPYTVADSSADFAQQAEKMVAEGGKAQMAPTKQHMHEFVFCTFSTFVHMGTRYYTVTVNIDPPKH